MIRKNDRFECHFSKILTSYSCIEIVVDGEGMSENLESNPDDRSNLSDHDHKFLFDFVLFMYQNKYKKHPQTHTHTYTQTYTFQSGGERERKKTTRWQ